MGCDYFYSGTLPDTKLQEKVTEFVQSYYFDVDLVVYYKLTLKAYYVYCHSYRFVFLYMDMARPSGIIPVSSSFLAASLLWLWPFIIISWPRPAEPTGGSQGAT